MRLTIQARNMSVSPAITQRIEKKTETMGKYLWPETEMQVKMRKEKNDRRVVEITVPMGKNVILRSESSADDNLFLAIDKALAKMERQIRKHRTRLNKTFKDTIFNFHAAEAEAIELNDTKEEEIPTIVKTKKFELLPMSVEEAIEQMDLLENKFFVYLNPTTGKVNIVYRRYDKTVGLIEPQY